ncbi:hypothetical protein BT96DRAFT_915526, partial [Gymnopus androsaceus JB14]
MQALQSLQEQQATIIGALAPLLPLLQNIPLHIESARTNLAESLSKSLQKRSNSSSSSSEPKRRRVAENSASWLPIRLQLLGICSFPRELPLRRFILETSRSSATRPHKSLSRTANRQPLAGLSYGAHPHPSDNLEPVPHPETPSGDPMAKFRQGYVPPASSKRIAERSPTVSITDAASVHQPSSPYISVAPATMTSRVQAPRTIDSKPQFKPAHIFSRTPAPASSVHGARIPGAMQPPPNALVPIVASVPVVTAPATHVSEEHRPSPLPPSTLRQRRSPFADAFIPLDDSDTSDRRTTPDMRRYH